MLTAQGLLEIQVVMALLRCVCQVRVSRLIKVESRFQRVILAESNRILIRTRLLIAIQSSIQDQISSDFQASCLI